MIASNDASSLTITCKSREAPITSVTMPILFFRDVIAATTYHLGDYNQDGKVSYGETRLYTMQYYKL